MKKKDRISLVARRDGTGSGFCVSPDTSRFQTDPDSAGKNFVNSVYGRHPAAIEMNNNHPMIVIAATTFRSLGLAVVLIGTDGGNKSCVILIG